MKKRTSKKRSAKPVLLAASKARRADAPQKAQKKASQKPIPLKKKTAVAFAAAPSAVAASSADSNLNKINHVVVLMMENRSFDHMLGYLKLNHGHASDGLVATMSNQFRGRNFLVHHLTNTAFKSGQDPSHDGASVTEQLLNNNGGFVANYAHTHPTDPEVDLVIVYDEHGGLFDHVVPPVAEDDVAAFRHLGVRVPAIIVSPWVDPKSISSDVFDHTSLIKTILTRFCRNTAGNIPSMGKRVAAANHLGSVLTRTSPAAPVNMSPVIAKMAKWKAEEFHATFAAAAATRALPGTPNELQLGLSKAREKLTKMGLPEGAL